jgi:protein-S-isoprenylcysteine O-methyltransferase Ste14
MLPRHLIGLCWIAFLLYWIISARAVKQTAIRQNWRGILAHRIPIWVGAIFLFFPKTDPFGIALFPHNNISALMGVSICLMGLWGAIWSRRTLADNWSVNVELKNDHRLVKGGPYRYVRHPIYTSILLMCLGTAVSTGSLAAFIGVSFFFTGFWIKLNQEEKLLQGHFSDEYPAYKNQVKALIPFVV